MIIDELGPSHLLATWAIMTLNKAIYLALVPDEGLWYVFFSTCLKLPKLTLTS